MAFSSVTVTSQKFKAEWAIFTARLGRRALPLHILLLAIFGIVLPWAKGIEFLDPVILSAYACLGVIFAAPASAQLFADPPRSMATVFTRIAIAVLYGELMSIGMIVLALATVYLTHPHLPIPPDFVSLAASIAFGIACSFALSAIAGWSALQFSPPAARAMIRVIFLTLLVVFFFRSRWLPDIGLEGALIALAAGAAALLAIRRTLAVA